MSVTAIYRLNPDGSREPLQPNREGHFVLVDTRIPYDAPGCRPNLRNRASLGVRAHSLEEAGLLLDLGYAARVKLANGQLNYLTTRDVTIERR